MQTLTASHSLLVVVLASGFIMLCVACRLTLATMLMLHCLGGKVHLDVCEVVYMY